MVFDKFHVITNVSKAVYLVRCAELRLGGKGVWESLNKSQWLWRKNPENLSAQQQERLGKIKEKNLCTAKAYQMRLVLQDIYHSPEATVAQRRFKVWCRWVRSVARFHKSPLFGKMMRRVCFDGCLPKRYLDISLFDFFGSCVFSSELRCTTRLQQEPEFNQSLLIAWVSARMGRAARGQ